MKFSRRLFLSVALLHVAAASITSTESPLGAFEQCPPEICQYIAQYLDFATLHYRIRACNSVLYHYFYDSSRNDALDEKFFVQRLVRDRGSSIILTAFKAVLRLDGIGSLCTTRLRIFMNALVVIFTADERPSRTALFLRYTPFHLDALREILDRLQDIADIDSQEHDVRMLALIRLSHFDDFLSPLGRWKHNVLGMWARVSEERRLKAVVQFIKNPDRFSPVIPLCVGDYEQTLIEAILTFQHDRVHLETLLGCLMFPEYEFLFQQHRRFQHYQRFPTGRHRQLFMVITSFNWRIVGGSLLSTYAAIHPRKMNHFQYLNRFLGEGWMVTTYLIDLMDVNGAARLLLKPNWMVVYREYILAVKERHADLAEFLGFFLTRPPAGNAHDAGKAIIRIYVPVMHYYEGRDVDVWARLNGVLFGLMKKLDVEDDYEIVELAGEYADLRMKTKEIGND